MHVFGNVCLCQVFMLSFQWSFRFWGSLLEFDFHKFHLVFFDFFSLNSLCCRLTAGFWPSQSSLLQYSGRTGSWLVRTSSKSWSKLVLFLTDNCFLKYYLALHLIILGTMDLIHSLYMLSSNTLLKSQLLKEKNETVCSPGQLVIILLQPSE